MKKAAGITLYNPDIDRLKENLDITAKSAERVICIDNGSKKPQQIDKLLSQYHNVSLIRNQKNMGIAKALNQIMEAADELGFDWILTLDQDSVMKPDLFDVYFSQIRDEHIGMMNCIIHDRKLGYSEPVPDEICTREEKLLITSGCLTNIHAWKECGGFDEWMFIDVVDFDMCATMQEKGWKTLLVTYPGLLHETGYVTPKKVLGRERFLTNYAPIRYYYMIRNWIYYYRKHPNQFAPDERPYSVCTGILTIILFENRHIQNTLAVFKGFLDGFFKKVR